MARVERLAHLPDGELYGPYPPGTERDYGDAYDSAGLAGTVTPACFKEVLSLLDWGRSPVEYVRERALSASEVVEE